MTWIHFKSAVTHPGLTPGLSTHLPQRCWPHGPSPAGTATCWGASSPSSSHCPQCRGHGCLLSAPCQLGAVTHGPSQAFPSSRQGGSGSRGNAPVEALAHPALRQLPVPQPGSSPWSRNRDGSVPAAAALDHHCWPPHHAAPEETQLQGIPYCQENGHSSRGQPPALSLAQGLRTTNMSRKHGVALGAMAGRLGL